MHTCIPSHRLKRSDIHDLDRWMLASKTPSMHHPQRRNVTTSKFSPKLVNPRDIAGERGRRKRKFSFVVEGSSFSHCFLLVIFCSLFFSSAPDLFPFHFFCSFRNTLQVFEITGTMCKDLRLPGAGNQSLCVCVCVVLIQLCVCVVLIQLFVVLIQLCVRVVLVQLCVRVIFIQF